MTDLSKYYELAKHISIYVADEKKIMPAGLQDWLNESEANSLLFNKLVEAEKIKAAAESYHNIDTDRAWKTVSEKLFAEKIPLRTRPLWTRIGVAASVLLISGAGLWHFYTQHKALNSLDAAHPTANNIILPGKNAATLTLADGRKITLSDAMNGELAKEGGVSIQKTQAGEIVYKVNGVSGSKKNDTEIRLNTISTARGEQYQIILPDGSKVWLNAASSLKYPASFNSFKERNVELAGEAYFEVFPNAKQPFTVKTTNQLITVLGTHFNIKSYSNDELTRTTLLEGSVSIKPSRTDGLVMLKPGQDFSFNELTGRSMLSKANIEQAMAWKNGYFYFQNEDIKTIMQDISRWYDIEINYEGKMTNSGYDGSISRFKNIKEVLEILELTGGVHFKINGRRVTVML